MKTCLFYLISEVLFFFVLIITPKTAFAGHPFGTEGWYCDQNSVWHDVPGTQPGRAYGHELREACGADEVCKTVPPDNKLYTQDAACQKTGATPAGGAGTDMRISPVPVIYSQNLTISVGSDYGCHDKISPTYNWQTRVGLNVGGRLGDCKTVQQDCGCETITETVTEPVVDPKTGEVTGQKEVQKTRTCGPDDWNKVNPIKDGKRCWTIISCRADGVGSFNAPLFTGDKTCDNNADYVISAKSTGTKISDCKTITGTRPKDNGGNTSSYDIRAHSLQDDEQNLNHMSAMLPDEVNNQLARLKTNPVPPLIGVLQDFFTQNDVNLACNIRGIPLIGGVIEKLIGGFCMKEVFFNDYEATNFFAKQSQVISNAVRPVEGISTPETRDCATDDIKQQDRATQKEIRTDGNQKIDNISTSIGTKTGIYSINLPDFNDIKLNVNINLNVQGVVLNGDERVPDINARCGLLSQSNLPDGISWCNDNP